MKILFITPPPYLPNRLHRIRAFDLIKILAKKHEVYLLAVTTQKEEPKEFREIKRVCKSVRVIKINKLIALLNCLRFLWFPYEVAYCYSQKVKQEIKKIINKENIDIVYLKRLRSAVLLPVIQTGMEGHISTDVGLRKIPRQARNDKVGIVLDSTDAMSMFYFRMYKNHSFPKNLFYLWQAILYRRFEKKVMEEIKNWIVCSEIDRKYLEKYRTDVNVHVVPNAVDTDYFFPSATSKVARNSLLFRGLMDKPVNVDACLFFTKEIMPLVKKKVKDVKLFIVGPKPNIYIKELHDGKNIFVTGYVDNIRKYIEKPRIVICPIRIASGTRFKILQSWSMGRPVVSTRIGAEGLLFKNNYNIAIADTPLRFAEKVIKLMQDKKYYSLLQRNGLEIVKKEHSLKAIGDKLERVMQKTC